MARRRHNDDYKLYEQLLESTRDSEGVCHRDKAVKLLTARLVENNDRVTEYAESRAIEVADNFDGSHSPETDNGQMALDIGNYLVIGDSERVQVDRAMAVHTRQWLGVLASNKARIDAAYGAKYLHGERLLAVQDEHKCSLWKAEQILRGKAA